MQRDIGESTSRTQMPTPPEPAAVGTRPPQLPPVFHHPHHHSPSSILSPSTNLQGRVGGPDAGGATQYLLTHFPSIHPPVWADRDPKERIRGKKEQTDGGRRHSACVSWPTTEILHLEITSGGYSEDWEEQNKECGRQWRACCSI